MPENLPPQANAQLRGLIFLALASAYDGAGDLERAVDAYAETIRWSRLGRSATGVAITYRMMGVLLLLGRLRAAEAACREALRFIAEQGMARLPAAGILHVAMAEVLLERNELEAAEDHLAQGHELGRRSGRLDAVRNAAPALVRLRLARGDARGALAAVAEAEAALGEPPPPLARAELLALKARILTRQGSLAEAAHCADEAARLAGQDRGQTGARIALAAARVHVAASQPREAVTLLTRALTAAEEDGRLGLALELRILRSLALWRQGAARAAEADLQAALALAEPEGYVRVFVDEGEPLAELLRKLATHPARTSASGSYSAQFLATLLAAFGAPGDSRSSTSSPQPGSNRDCCGTGPGTRGALRAITGPCRAPLGARAGSAPADGRRPHQRTDRRQADHRAGHGQGPHPQYLRQAGCAEPRARRCPCARTGSPLVSSPIPCAQDKPYK